jgi:hypothetical protein
LRRERRRYVRFAYTDLAVGSLGIAHKLSRPVSFIEQPMCRLVLVPALSEVRPEKRRAAMLQGIRVGR